MIPIDELPVAWGLLELNDEKRIFVAKPATKTEAEPISRGFMAAMVRAAGRVVSGNDDTLDAMIKEHKRRQDEQFEERVKQEAARLTQGRDRDSENWKRLREAVGDIEDRFFGSSSYVNNDTLIEAVKFVIKSEMARSWNGVVALHKTVAEFEERLRGALTGFGIIPAPIPTKKPAKKRGITPLAEFYG